MRLLRLIFLLAMSFACLAACGKTSGRSNDLKNHRKKCPAYIAAREARAQQVASVDDPVAQFEAKRKRRQMEEPIETFTE
ncbi:hypothetical protein C8F01DRAFT_1231674, partial [Mycena amicta]